MKCMVRILCSALFTAFLFSCTMQLAGNGSEITNGYCAISAVPADNAMVVAYPDDYIPYPPSAGPETTFTDKNGRFSMRLGKTGWNLVIYDKRQEFGAFVPLPKGDSTIDTIMLDSVGAIHGIINDTMADSRFIGVIGSPFYAGITGRTDTFSLIKMPPFTYLINMWQAGSNASENQTGDTKADLRTTAKPITVTVRPDSTTEAIITP
jgi:hypothetical protein